MADVGSAHKSPVDIRLRSALKKKSAHRPSSLLGSFRQSDPEIIQQPKDMAASFLQYCAMCEKQITTPCNSILYCSEACRRKDSSKPLSAATINQATPPSSAPSSPIRPILTSRNPTGTYFDTPSARIPADLHNHKSDLDPTEWKPKLPHRKDSEAFRFLSQFHRSTSNTSVNDGSSMNGGIRIDVPMSMPTPSLANTPTTTASSLSTSSGNGYNNNSYGGYDFNTRPLPLRHNRWFSADGATPRGTDLVTPHIAPAIITEESFVEGDEDLWGKKTIVRGSSYKSNGLGKLFNAEK